MRLVDIFLDLFGIFCGSLSGSLDIDLFDRQSFPWQLKSLPFALAHKMNIGERSGVATKSEVVKQLYP